MKTYEELAAENEMLKNKLSHLLNLNQEAYIQLLEANKKIREYEDSMKVERFRPWN